MRRGSVTDPLGPNPMARTFMDADLREWEVFVNAGQGGFPHPQRIVFRCVSDRTVPSRIHALPEGAASGAEVVRGSETGALRDLLAGAEPLS